MSPPKPLPSWYWPWVQWRLGEGPYKGDPRNPVRRPDGVPATVPAWAWLKLSDFLARRKRLVRHDYSFWHGMSAWVTRIDHFPPEYAQAYAKDDYRLIIIPTLKGTELEGYPDGTSLTWDSLRSYVWRLHNLGYRVAGSQWGWAKDIQAEAEAGADAVRRVGFDGWVMNGEKLWEGGARSHAYATRFRQLHPMLPFGWSPEPRLDLDHGTLQSLGVAYMPQAYPLENGRDVSYCVEWGLNFGYKREAIIPLVQAYTTNGERYPAERFRAQARVHGLGGLCLYPANQAVDVPQWWRELVL